MSKENLSANQQELKLSLAHWLEECVRFSGLRYATLQKMEDLVYDDMLAYYEEAQAAKRSNHEHDP